MPTAPRDWTAPELLQLSGGYWSACALQAAVRLDLFTHLAAAPSATGEAAAHVGADQRGLLRLLEALAALGLVTRDAEGLWSPAPAACRHLARSGSAYLGHIITHHQLIMDAWSRLPEAVRTGAPTRERSSHLDDEAAREAFLMGMYDLANLAAPRVAAAIDLSGRRHLLDLGGGPGTYAIHFCRRHVSLRATVCDLPTTRGFAERTIAAHGLADRITFADADYNLEPIPCGFDAAWLSHVLHGEGPAGAAALVRKAAGSLEPGGLLLVQEFILDDDRLGPPHPALFGLNMLVGTPDGQSYSGTELAAMLTAAGAGDIHRLPLELPNGAGIIAGTMGTA
ncbi:MAG: methyltransferase domain-containing protein [bacterium]|nr:methyltransferase domain-containing protein [bacterium]